MVENKDKLKELGKLCDFVLKDLQSPESQKRFIIKNMEKICKSYEEISNDVQKREVKNLSILIKEETFQVTKVIRENIATYIYPELEKVYGKTSSSYRGGYTVTSFLEVEAENLKIPTTNLDFKGYTNIQAGDRINVKMPIYNTRKVSYNSSDVIYEGRSYNAYFIRTHFNKKEDAIEITKIDKLGNELSVDRAVNYSDFQK